MKPGRAPRARSGVSLRIAARNARRSIGSSLLIAVLIALPIAGLSMVAVVGQSREATTSERIVTALGRAQALVKVVSVPDPNLKQNATDPQSWRNGLNFTYEQRGDSLVSPADVLPEGTKIVPVFSTSVVVGNGDAVATLQAIEGAPWDAALRGHFDVVRGRTPDSSSEVMVTQSALARLGVPVGGTIGLTSPRQGTLTIVGVLADRSLPSSTELIFGRTGALSVAVSHQTRITQTDYYLPSARLDWSAVQNLNKEGMTALSRKVLLDPPPPNGVSSFTSSPLQSLLAAALLLGGFTVFEVVLLAGAAFAVGARQQQRTLAIVASIGGTRSSIFRIVSAGGLVLGALGGILGGLLGIGASAVFMALSSDGSATRYYGFHVNWLLFAGIVIFSVVVGWIAALAPAVTASRMDIVGALRGARRPPRPSRRRPLVGILVLAIGILLALVAGIGLAYLASLGRTIGHNGGRSAQILTVAVIAGPIIAQLGLALCGPVVLRFVASLFGRAKLGARLAARDAARNPARSVPAFTAILTTVFVAVFAMCTAASAQAASVSSYTFTTITGQVSSSLWYSDPTGSSIVRANDSSPFVSAITDNLPGARTRVLSAVPDFDGFVGTPMMSADPLASASREGYPVLTIPAKNVCPLASRSPDYVANPGSATITRLEDDPRCLGNNFLMSSTSYGARLWVGDAADLSLVLGREASPEAHAALAAGNAVALYPNYVSDGRIEIDHWSKKELEENAQFSNDPVSVQTVAAVVDQPVHPINFGVFLPRATADRLGLPYAQAMVLAALKTAPTTSQLDAARAATARQTALPSGESLSIENGPSSATNAIAWILLGISAVIAIGSSAVAIGLARFDGRKDDATLDSLGARPTTRRAFAFWQTLVLAGLGTVLGALLGLLPALALGLPGSTLPFTPPWLQIAATAIALPLVIAAGSWLLAGGPSNRSLQRTV